MKFRHFLPFLLAAAILLSFAAIPHSTSAQVSSDTTVVAFGDSITASGAWFSDAENTYGITVINKGVGGWNSKDGRKDFSGAIALNPDVLLISFGMNDSARDMAKYVPLETYRENMRYMIEGGLNAGAKVILVIENPIGEDDYYTRHDRAVFEPYGGISAFYLQYVEVARALAEEYGLIVMDMHRIFTEEAEKDDCTLDDLLADGVHPSARGYALYAAALTAALADALADEPSDEPTGIPGDVTGDGKVNALDYLLVKRHVLGTYTIGERIACADVNGDGSIDAEDYLLIKRAVLGSHEIG